MDSSSVCPCSGHVVSTCYAPASLSLSLSLTHTHRTHSLSLSLSHSLSVCLSVSLSHTHSMCVSFSASLSLCLYVCVCVCVCVSPVAMRATHAVCSCVVRCEEDEEGKLCHSGGVISAWIVWMVRGDSVCEDACGIRCAGNVGIRLREHFRPESTVPFQLQVTAAATTTTNNATIMTIVTASV